MSIIRYIVILLLIPLNAGAVEYFIAPGASNSACTEANPGSFSQAIAKADVTQITLRGGTYDLTGTRWIVSKSITLKAYTAETPIVDGAFADSTPANQGMIQVTAGSVTIDGLTVRRSYRTGVSFNNANAINGHVLNCTLQYCYQPVLHTGYAGVTNNSIFEDSTFEWGNFDVDATGGGSIVSVVKVQGGGSIVRNNIIRYGSRAGIEPYYATDATITGNQIYGSAWKQVHLARDTNITVTDNVIYGMDRPTPAYSAPYFNNYGNGIGIAVETEFWYDGSTWDSGHVITGNMIANVDRGIAISYSFGSGCNPKTNPGCYGSNTVSNSTIINNTVINPITSGCRVTPCGAAVYVNNDQSNVGTGNVLKNNIFFQSGSSTAVSYYSGLTGVISIGYNLYNKIPASGLQDATDPTYGVLGEYPPLSISDYWTKTDWTGLTAGSISETDFDLLSSAVYAIDTGTDLGLGNDVGARQYSSDVTNLALNKTVTASSEQSTPTSYPAENAVDGDAGTRWGSAYQTDPDPDSAWFKVDLGQTYSVDRVNITWETAYGLAYTIQVSTNDSDWSTVYTEAAGDGGTDNLSFAAADARYVKIVCTDRGTVYGYSIYEFEVYGAAASPFPKVTANCWCDSNYDCLAANQTITKPNEWALMKLTGDSAFYSPDGPAVFAAQVTAGATNSKTLVYVAGYGTTSLILGYQSQPLDRFASLQFSSTDPVSQGTTTITDDTTNPFDMDGDAGLDNALTYYPVFAVETMPVLGGSSNAGAFKNTNAAQPLKGN